MLKVKIFDEEHENDLENEINTFLETIDPSKVKDLQYQVAVAEDPQGLEMVFCFSAIILYVI